MQQQYQIKLSIPGRIVIAIILPGLAITPIFIGLALYFPRADQWVVYSVIIVCMAMAILAVKYAVNVLLAAKAILTLREDGFQVAFEKKNFFTPASFVVNTQAITNFSIGNSTGSGTMSFETSTRPSKFSLAPASLNPADIVSFAELNERISELIEANNNRVGVDTPRVTNKTMYEYTWAKAVAAIMLLALIIFPLISLFNTGVRNPPWWKLAGTAVIAFPFLFNVYYHNFRKRKP